MKVAELQKPHELRLRSKPLRTLAQGEVLVKIESCGVCGTDLHIFEGKSRCQLPVVLGHEFAGFIEDAGTTDIALGTHVVVDPNIACGACPYCRRGLVHLCTGLRALGVDIDGGMAEFCIVPSRQIYVLPHGMSAEESMFVEPVSCAIHGIDKAEVKTGDVVLILGGGTIGLLMLQLVKRAGASTVVLSEPVAWKRSIAGDLGATLVVDPASDDLEAVVRDVSTIGADVVIECAGTPATARLALGLARRGGTVELFGVCPIGLTVPMEPNAVYFNELTIVGSYVNPYTFDRAIAALRGGLVQVKPMKVAQFSLEAVGEALSSLREGRTLKNMIVPDL